MDLVKLRGWLTAQAAISRFKPDFSDDKVWDAWLEFFDLRQITREEIFHAVRALAGHEEFPIPADIFQWVQARRGSDADSPEAAFEKLISACRKWGAMRTPELPDKIGIAVSRLGGWRHICQNWDLIKNRAFHFRDFREVYVDLCDRETRGLPLGENRFAIGAGKKPAGYLNPVQKLLMENSSEISTETRRPLTESVYFPEGESGEEEG